MPNAWLLQIAVFFFVKSRNGSLNEFTTTEYGGRVGGGGVPLNSFSNRGTQIGSLNKVFGAVLQTDLFRV